MSLSSQLSSLHQLLSQFSIHHLHTSPFTFIVILLFLFSFFLLLTSVLMFLCCRVRRESLARRDKKSDSSTRGFFSLSLARLDEFDTLTPLIVTPSSFPPIPPSLPRIPQFSSLPLDRSSSESPPPPRRPPSSKTLIVPLNISRYRSPLVPLLGTPDSRVTSFETGTTKSCATIPEDDEETADLVSIDRTSVSTSTQVKLGSRQLCFNSTYNINIPEAPPSFQIAPPSYTPPDPPLNRPSRLKTEGDKIRKKRSPTSPNSSCSIGSPASSMGSVSPMESCLSDSFIVNDASGRSITGVQGTEDSQSKYQLHRIEEESECMGDDSVMAYSRTDGSIVSSVKGHKTITIPRSISEQFELMRLKKI